MPESGHPNSELARRSVIQHPTIRHPTFRQSGNPASGIRYPVSDIPAIRHPASGIGHPVSGILEA
jgi:hypothetical protein